MPLTTKRIAFVEHYLNCWNASEAARRAGYKQRNEGSRLLTNAEVQAYVQLRLDAICMTANETLVRLASIARGEHTPLSRDTIKALELIGKAHKLFVDRQEIEVEHGASDALLSTISNSLSRGYGHSNENE